MKNHGTDAGITRREVLRRALIGGAGLAFAGRMSPVAFAGTLPAATRKKRARARTVIQVWLWGGPSHLDTFDPKPEAGYNYCGPWSQPITAKGSGARICQLLPKLAAQGDKYSLIRSVAHGAFGHETAAYIVQTGDTPGRERRVYPSAGAVVSMFKGYDHGYKSRIPPWVVMTRPLGRFSEVGFLGLKYKPFVTGGDPSKKRFAVEGIVAEGISDDRQRHRRELLEELDTLGHSMPDDPRFEKFDSETAKAYEMILGDAGKVFDLSREKDKVRDAYGRNRFGQSCLAARRLVEKGVPFIQINYEGWDTHKRNFEILGRKLPEFDQGLSTLLSDLSQKGLLDRTIVWCTGEFGRTPKVMWEAPWNGGRGHWGDCFSMLLAGGGFKGGRIVGASDAHGEQPIERRTHPRDVIGSIYELMGIDAAAPMPNSAGLHVPVLPPGPDGKQPFHRLSEILP